MKSNQTRRRATVKRKKLELATLFHHYEVHNRSEGKSARTVEWYGQVLELFQKWMVSEGKSTFLEDIGRTRSGSSPCISREGAGSGDSPQATRSITGSGRSAPSSHGCTGRDTPRRTS